MNRRNFLTSMAAAIGGMTLDPEKLLWVPGRKLISIPKIRVAEIDGMRVRFTRQYFSRPEPHFVNRFDVLWDFEQRTDGRWQGVTPQLACTVTS